MSDVAQRWLDWLANPWRNTGADANVPPQDLHDLLSEAATAKANLRATTTDRDEWKARALRAEGALLDIAEHAEQRIKDGADLGARVWRIALVDVSRDARVALPPRD